MRAKFLTEKTVALLRKSIGAKADHYLKGRADLALAAVDPGGIAESRIEVGEEPNLQDGAEADSANARAVFNWLKHLTPVQAADPRLWTYLAHGPFAGYVGKRWPIGASDKIEDRVTERYFVAGQGLASMSRNGVARLWWGAWQTRDEKLTDAFELTDVLFSLQDLQVAFLERAMGRSSRLLRTALQVWKKRCEETEFGNKGPVVQKWAKLIRLQGGVAVLDALPDKLLEGMLWTKLALTIGEDFELDDETEASD